jgi:hypothetical protein
MTWRQVISSSQNLFFLFWICCVGPQFKKFGAVTAKHKSFWTMEVIFCYFFRKLHFIGARCDVKTRAHQSKAACGSVERFGIPDATQRSFIVSVKFSIVRPLLISDSHLIVYRLMWRACPHVPVIDDKAGKDQLSVSLQRFQLFWIAQSMNRKLLYWVRTSRELSSGTWRRVVCQSYAFFFPLLVTYLTYFRPWRWRRQVPPKHKWALLHVIVAFLAKAMKNCRSTK